MAGRSIQGALSQIAGAVVLVSLVTAAGLIWATTNIGEQVADQHVAFRSIRAAEHIEAALVKVHRAGVLMVVTGDPLRRIDLERAWGEVDQWIGVAATYVTTEREADALRELEERVRTLKDAWRDLGPEPSDEEVARLGQLGTETMGAAAALVYVNLDQAQEGHDVASRVDQSASMAGALLAVLVLVVTGVGMARVRALTTEPILEVREAMSRFGGGDIAVRAPTDGPSEIREIAATFNRAADALARQREMQLAFVASIAHDLKNPLFALQLAAQLSAKTQAHDTQAARTSAMVLRQVDQLVRMVDDLLDASRIEAGRLELRRERVDVRDIASGVFELLRGVSPSHELRLRLPPAPVFAEVDAHRITQMLTNLVSNAVKYSPRGGPVDICVRAAEAEVVLQVSDQGIGIPPEDRDRIFEPFRRGSTGDAVARGVGLGLSVSKRIVEAHGGGIEIVSAVGQGSTFCVHLPRRAPAPAEGPEVTTGWTLRPEPG